MRPAAPPACEGQGQDVTKTHNVRTGLGCRIVASTVDEAAVVIGHLPAGLEPGSWASPGPSSSTETRRKPSGPVTLRKQQARGNARRPTREILHTADSARRTAVSAVRMTARRSACYGTGSGAVTRIVLAAGLGRDRGACRAWPGSRRADLTARMVVRLVSAGLPVLVAIDHSCFNRA